MTCLGCNTIETRPVTLHGGRVVCNECPDYRAECEARNCLTMSDDEWKRYHGLVLRQRGKEAAQQLVDDVRRLQG